MENNTVQEFLFDVRLHASFRIKGANESEARHLLAEALDCACINAGEINSHTLIGEASMDGDAVLVEIDDKPIG